MSRQMPTGNNLIFRHQVIAEARSKAGFKRMRIVSGNIARPRPGAPTASWVLGFDVDFESPLSCDLSKTFEGRNL